MILRCRFTVFVALKSPLQKQPKMIQNLCWKAGRNKDSNPQPLSCCLRVLWRSVVPNLLLHVHVSSAALAQTCPPEAAGAFIFSLETQNVNSSAPGASGRGFTSPHDRSCLTSSRKRSRLVAEKPRWRRACHAQPERQEFAFSNKKTYIHTFIAELIFK